MRAWLLCIALTTSAVARADHFFSATFFQHHELRSITAGSALGPGIGWTWLLDPHFAVGAGARFNVPTLNMRPSLEGYVRGGIVVPFKFWAPSLGLEFGFSAGWGERRSIRPSEQVHDELNSEAPRARTVRFVGYDLEEFGLLGSTRMTRSQSTSTARADPRTHRRRRAPALEVRLVHRLAAGAARRREHRVRRRRGPLQPHAARALSTHSHVTG